MLIKISLTVFLFSITAKGVIWKEAVFKLTDCPRNMGNSATPPDKEDLIQYICPEKCYINFHFPFQCKITKNIDLKANNSCIGFPSR